MGQVVQPEHVHRVDHGGVAAANELAHQDFRSVLARVARFVVEPDGLRGSTSAALATGLRIWLATTLAAKGDRGVGARFRRLLPEAAQGIDGLAIAAMRVITSRRLTEQFVSSAEAEARMTRQQ